jgi:hypothetical protein
VLLYTLVLFGACLMPYLVGMSGLPYLLAASTATCSLLPDPSRLERF